MVLSTDSMKDQALSTGFEAGSKLGPYELLAPIGRGGMGEVWQARDTRLGRLVAIKRLSRRYTPRFAKEAKAIAALNHPHICTLHDVGPDYLVMEYVEGCPVKGPLPPEEAVRLAVQIAEALAEAHSKRVLHCDLKPANVLVTPRGMVKLLDFGVARLLTDPAGDATMTIEDTIAGTAGYMSPEQARGLPLDARTDVFSFGAVLYEMLAGRPAFTGNTAAETMSALLRDEPRPLDAPAELVQIVTRCLRKSSADRFPSMAEVIAAMEATRRGETQGRSPLSIAVLPFANMSGDADNDYFSDGLTEEIINALTKMPGLSVTARTSAFSFRGKNVEVHEIARKLNVVHILEGSVRRAANRVRVTAQLIKADSGFHVWSERYDRELTDIFAIQDDISGAIAAQLKVTLLPGAAPRRRIPKLPAYEAFLESRHHWQKMTPAAFAKSLQCVGRALAIDPEYADAHVGLAAYYFSVAWHGGADPREMMPKARAAALKALSLEEDSALAHACLGSIKAVFEYDWAAAGEHFQRALALDRTLYVSLPYTTWYLRPMGRLEEALAELEALRKLDPLSAATRSEMADVLLLMRRYDEAAEVAQQALGLDADYMLAQFTLLTARVEQKRYDDAIALAERAVEAAGRWQVPLTYLGYAYAAAGRLAEAQQLRDEMYKVARRVHVNATAFANICVALGEIDTGVKWLEKAIEQREPIVTLLKTWSMFDPVRSHPDYPELLRKMNLLTNF